MATVHDLGRWERDIERQNEGWRGPLLVNAKGQPRPVEFNVAVVLQHHPDFAGRLRFNELSQAAECSALPWKPCEGWRPWEDVDDAMLAAWCQYEEIMAKPATCATAVQMVACQHPHHPVREYLNGLEWDGVARLDTWLSKYLGATVGKGREEYLRQVGRSSLMQAVARIYDPGCKVDHVPVLQGSEGIGKSSAIRALAGREEWFADEISDLGSKDAAQDLRGKWLFELAELSAVRRSDVERTKAFMSRAVDHYRPSYGRRSQDHPRHCVFWGTTNHDTYLQSEAGNRRNWHVECTKIDLDALRRDRDQLWAEAVHAYRAGETWWLDAEAVHAYRAGETWWLDAEAEALAAEVQEDRRIVDVWEDQLLEWVGRQ